MINSISNNINAMHKAMDRIFKNSVKIARGDIDAKKILDTKVDMHDVKTQAKVIKAVNKIEDEVLNILA